MRRWHLEHADGREWTRDELDAVCDGYDQSPCADVLLDRDGVVALVTGMERVIYIGHTVEDEDMEVVWDE